MPSLPKILQKVNKLNGDFPTPSSTTPNANGTASTGTETAYARGDHVHPLQATVDKLTTARTISLSGDLTGSGNFDGSSNTSISVTLSNSGVSAGSAGPTENVTGSNEATVSIPRITVDAKGRVTGLTSYTLTCKDTQSTTATSVQVSPDDGSTFNLLSAWPYSTSTSTCTLWNIKDVTVRNGVITAKGFSGNASTATKLSAAKTISLTGAVTGSGNFDGSANLSIATTLASGAGGGSDTNVTQTVSTTNNTYPVLAVATANQTATTTGTSIFSTKIKLNPSTGDVSATSFTGKLIGNADTASKVYHSDTSSNATKELILSVAGSTDYFGIRHQTGSDLPGNSVVDIAIGDDGDEGIYFTQYKGGAGLWNANNISSRIILLDSSHNSTFPGNITANSFNYGSVAYDCQCGTAAATAAKAVTLANYTLKIGTLISCKMRYANTAANPTLNINSTGALNIYTKFYTSSACTQLTAGGWAANDTVLFEYNGTGYTLISVSSEKDNYQGVCTTAIGTVAKVSTINNFILKDGCIVGVYFTTGNSAANPTLNISSTGALPIYTYYYSSTVYANIGSFPAKTLLYLQYNGTGYVVVSGNNFVTKGIFAGGYFGTTVAVSASEIDTSLGSVFTKTISANTTFTITGVPSGQAACFSLILTNGGSKLVSWPSSVKWSSTAPSLKSSGVNVITFVTPNGGTTWYGALSL